MLKMLTTTALAAALAVVGVAAFASGGNPAAGGRDHERLADMPICDEVVVTAEKPDWLIDEVVAVAKRSDSATGDSSNPQLPWLYETEVAGRHTVLPTATN